MFTGATNVLDVVNCFQICIFAGQQTSTIVQMRMQQML